MDIFLKTVGALNDETRVQILHFVHQNGEVCVCEIESAFEMIQSRISRHLKILKDAGFLRVERRGKWAYYAIRSPLDSFRLACLEEILHLGIALPSKTPTCKATL
ncbi:MAG: metalloregulator ArsR/SmtB family transcription factor [Sulfurospirillaceae bacterium]|nr:metalloregulator ArsR/SmtB family transcription factor [Sulfurospirillaceae bacterium]